MKQRAIEFKNIFCAVPDEDLLSSTDNELTNWYAQWGNYIQHGGDRPPTNPKHP